MLLKIKLARHAINMSQDDVAKALNIAARTYGNYEAGTSTLPIDVFLKLPAIFNVSIADLLPDSVVTAVDQRRSKDPKLEEIIQNWPELSDQAQQTAVTSIRTLIDLERQIRSLRPPERRTRQGQ